MNKGTIIYFGGFELPDKNPAAQRAVSLSKSFRDLGYHIVLVGLCKTSTNLREMPVDTKEENGLKMTSWVYPRTIAQWCKHLFFCKREVNVIRETPDVAAVVCYNYSAISLWKLNKFCIANNITLIADVTEWYPPSKKRFPFNILKNLDTVLRMRYVQPKLSNIICISKFLYEYYAHKVKNCIFIPGTVDQADQKWNFVMEYKQNEFFTLGYAGNPGVKCEKERVDLLIYAVCKLNQEGYSCQLKIAGFDKVAFEHEYPYLANLRYYTERIRFLGKLSHIECLKLISSVDFSVIVREDTRVTQAGFPTKLSESFACGTPVIATPSSNIADFIVEGENGLITRDFSCSALMDTIRQALCFDKKKLTNMHEVTRVRHQMDYKRYNNAIGIFIESLKDNHKC